MGQYANILKHIWLNKRFFQYILNFAVAFIFYIGRDQLFKNGKKKKKKKHAYFLHFQKCYESCLCFLFSTETQKSANVFIFHTNHYLHFVQFTIMVEIYHTLLKTRIKFTKRWINTSQVKSAIEPLPHNSHE